MKVIQISQFHNFYLSLMLNTVLFHLAFDQLTQADQKFNEVLKANRTECLSHIQNIEDHLDDICQVMQKRYTFFKQKKYDKIHGKFKQSVIGH